ncbi:hypothetical protein GSI_02744 [Ganoderma sinense ZZ0214-1]|uniref:Uncharacterized protein n=1 Tax=Ganoderma sinense ZZ0214-1 TaxID=1077348 RepID=A0A2G8SMG0_9APHY|nr:hypothetical protein GSI_02744 [Ganoderma sinense ZZ0214-1]
MHCAIPLDYLYILLVPKAFQTCPHLAIYDFSQADIPSHHLCTLLLPDEDSDIGEEAPWYQAHTGDRLRRAFLRRPVASTSMVVLTFYHIYSEDNSERGNHYLIPRTTLLAQIRAPKSRQTQTQLQTHSLSGGATRGSRVPVPAVPWADWGPQGCLRLSLQCRQVHRACLMSFGSRFPLFIVDKEDPGKAFVYVFDINPLVACHERQLLTTRHHPNPSISNAMSGDPAKGVTGMVVEDIEAVLPGLVDPDCSRIPYIAYRFQLPDVLMEWREGQFIGRVAMGMTGFTIKMVGGEYEKAEQTWTV